MPKNYSPLPAPKNEKEFLSFMEAVDQRLAEKQMPVVDRQLGAVVEVCRALGQKRIRIPNSTEPKPGFYDRENLVLHAISWYEKRYGDALKVYMGPGLGLVVLRGDVWIIQYPMIYGRVGFHTGNRKDGCHVIFSEKGPRLVQYDSPDWQNPNIPKCDIFEYVHGLPPAVRDALPSEELETLAFVFCRDRLFLQALSRARANKRRYIAEARADLDAAVRLLGPGNKSPGQAKWSCLQGVEKAFKSYLHHTNQTYPTRGGKGHDLYALAEMIQKASGPRFARKLIDRVQCSASVRYERETVALEEAIRAFFSALELAGTTAMELEAYLDE